jgi:hypothetical protein
MFHAPHPRRRAAIAVLTVVVSTACTGSGPGGDAEIEPAPTSAPAAAREVPPTGETGVEPGVDPEAVVVAADLLITGGDVEQAVADGVITEADVEVARAGLDDGSLGDLFD